MAGYSDHQVLLNQRSARYVERRCHLIGIRDWFCNGYDSLTLVKVVVVNIRSCLRAQAVKRSAVKIAGAERF